MSSVHRASYGGEGPTIMVVTWAEAAVALCLVFARLFAASIRRGELRWDFFWVVVASVLGLTSQTILTVATTHGIGSHISKLDLSNIITALRLYWISISVGLFAIAAAKGAIIALLLGVEGPAAIKRRYFLHFLWISNVLASAVLVAFTFTQCTPRAKIWNPLIFSGNCDLKPTAIRFGYFQGAWAAFTDILLAAYPILIVWNLQSSKKMKLGFCILMSGGVLAAVACIVRTVYIRTLNNTLDVTYEFADFMIWAGTELWCIIIIGSIPPLRPLFLKLFRKAKLSTIDRSRSGYEHGTDEAAYGNGTVNQKSMELNTYGGKTGRGLTTFNTNHSDENVLIDMPKNGIYVHSTFDVMETKDGETTLVEERQY